MPDPETPEPDEKETKLRGIVRDEVTKSLKAIAEERETEKKKNKKHWTDHLFD